jgi:hypothetical protein
MKRLILGLLLAGACWAQEDRVTVPFRDAARPKIVRVNLIDGQIQVRAHQGKELIVELGGRGGSTPAQASGMRKLNVTPGLQIDEENNVVNVRVDPPRRGNLVLLVPSQTSLNLRGVNGCRIDVENVDGDIEANCVNGTIAMRNVSGSVVAHAVNGKVLVTMDRLDANKPLALSSLNGDVDLTVPAATKADLRMKSTNGDVYTDFEVTIQPTPSGAVERTREGGKYRVRIDRGVQGTINGGGPMLSMTTMNGNVYLRKK